MTFLRVLGEGEKFFGRRSPMKKLLACLGAAIFALVPVVSIAALPLPHQEMKALRKQHKEQRKTLKQQQRAMKRVMTQHDLPSESQQRFRRNLKMQREELRRRQKDETRRLKHSHKAAEQAHLAK